MDQLKTLQAEKEEHQLPRPPAEVHCGQRDQRLRDSLHGHILTSRRRTRPLPFVALEYKLRKICGQAGGVNVAPNCTFHRPILLLYCPCSLHYKPRAQVQTKI